MPNMNSQQESINRRRQLAAILAQEAGTPPTAPNVPGALTSPLVGIANLLGGFLARRSNKNLDKEQKTLDTSTLADRQSSLSGLVGALAGPAQGVGDEAPRQDRISSLVQALSAADPAQQQVGQAALANMLKQQQEQQSNDAAMALQNSREYQIGQRESAQLAEQNRHNLAVESGASSKATEAQRAALRKSGLKLDADGNIVPIEETEMSATELADLQDKRALSDYRAAQKELAEATAAAKSDTTGAAAVKAQQAAQRLAIASQRLNLSNATYDARYLGQSPGGAALPGAMITDSGQPVGSTFSANVRPTGTERNKADMANSAKDQLQDIRKIVQKRPDIFGPISGRKTDFTVWVGSQDPDAQAFRAARTIAGDHLAGTFGGRSETALTALDAAIGAFKDNPAALLSGLDQLEKANDAFIKAGTVRSVGSSAAPASAPATIQLERGPDGKLRVK